MYCRIGEILLLVFRKKLLVPAKKQLSRVFITRGADRGYTLFAHVRDNFGNLHNVTGFLSILDRAAQDKFLFRLGVGKMRLYIRVSGVCGPYFTIGTTAKRDPRDK